MSSVSMSFARRRSASIDTTSSGAAAPGVGDGDEFEVRAGEHGVDVTAAVPVDTGDTHAEQSGHSPA